MTVVAVIPAKDEADRVAETVRAALAVPGVTRVLVVDDGSSDDTADVAAGAGAKVVRLARDVGKGAALEAGLSRAEDADIVLLLDADLCDSASEAAPLLAPVLAGETDLAVAILPRPAGAAGFGLVKRLARLGVARLGGGFQAKAPLSGQRALNRAAVVAVRPLGGGFGVEVTMTVRALRAGLRVAEVPTAISHRASGRDLAGFAHRGRQFAHVALALLALSFERAPRRGA